MTLANVFRLLFVGFLPWFSLAYGEDTVSQRLKDLVEVQGSRTNSLMGLGLVVGLRASGDSAASLATSKAASQLFTRLGIPSKPSEVLSQNLAVVVVTADLPAFAKSGMKVDVKVSTLGDAGSLQGGTLLLTPLTAGDGHTYLSAQGAISLGSGERLGSTTVGRVVQGGYVERDLNSDFHKFEKIVLVQKNSDFTNMTRIVDSINSHFSGFIAKPLDATGIEVQVPISHRDRVVEFVSELEQLSIVPDRKATIVVNERSGTVVLGTDVQIDPVTISQGGLVVSIEGGQTDGLVSVEGTTIQTLVESLNTMNASPSEIISILQAIHAAGALKAELKFL